MDFQSNHQNPLNAMNYQFQNVSLQSGSQLDPAVAQMGTPVPASAAQPLTRQTSIMDSIGIQRSSSPYVDPSLGLNAASVTPIATGAVPGASASPSTAPVSTANPALTPGHMLNSLSHQNPVVHGSASPSAYPSQMATPNVLHGGLFGSVPPGVSGSAAGKAPPFVIDSQWRYIDTQGQVQGPFESGPMSQWYASGYFQPSLQISRLPTTLEPFSINDRFISLGELISKVNNFQDPFRAFDLITTNILPNIGSALNIGAPPGAVSAPTPGTGAAASVDRAVTGPFQQQPVANKAVPSEDYTHAEILKLRDLDGGYYHDTVVQVPTGQKKQEKVDNQESIDKIVEGKRENLKKKDEKKREEEETRRKQKAEEAAKQLLEQENEAKKKEESKKSKKSQKQKESQPKLVPTEPQPKESLLKEQTVKPVSVQPATEVKTSVAPWADKVKNAELPKIPSISELQKREQMERAQKQHQEKIAANKLKEQIIKEDKERQELKSVLTWADKPKPSPVGVDIKLQLKNEEKKKPTQKQETVTLDEFNDPNFLKEQAKLWEEAQQSKNKRSVGTSSVISASGSSGGPNTWTTVASKPSKQVNANSQQKPIVQPKSYISPDKLRAIGSNTASRQIGSSTSIPGLKAKQTQPTPAYPGNASISARQDFLRWCRSRMQLNASVRKDAVLEVLLSLSAGGESIAIIADTINSNSNAMDGKRFAEEFIKRRQEVEKHIKDPLTWTEVLSMPEGDDDDWEFQVVSKKKGRKH